MPALLLLTLLTLGFGFALAWVIWPSDSSWRAMLLRLFLGFGLGIGFVSVFFFLTRLAGRNVRGSLFLLILAVLTIILLLLAFWRSSWKIQLGLHLPRRASQWLWLALLGLALVFAANNYLGWAIAHPEGDWDAWAIWNMHARFLAQADNSWRLMFDPLLYLSHPDYPLLTPGFIALGWQTMGSESNLAPILSAALFTFGIAGLLFASLNYQTGFPAACLATIILLISRSFIPQAALLYADIPLAFMILAAVVLLFLFLERRQPAFLILAGITCGLAAWTKNEGWTLLVAALFGLVIASLVQRPSPRQVFSQLGWFFVGIFPFLLLVLYHKLVLAPPNDIFSGRSLSELLETIGNPQRWGLVADRVLYQINFYGYRVFILLALFAFVVGLSKRPKLPLAVGWLVLAMVAAQYFLIYLITPYDLDWHLSNSLERLVTHLFPAIFFLVFSWVNFGHFQEDKTIQPPAGT
jgi:hypothetical protein